MRHIRLISLTALCLVVLSSAASRPVPVKTTLAAASGSWTQYHFDDAHTGYDPSLGLVNSVGTGWTSVALDEQIYASPLIFNGVVYAATLNNTVYALNQSTGAVIWSKNVGAPQTSGWSCGNINPTGILGTPVIDTAANRLYAVAEITGTTPTYHLFGLDLANAGNVVLDTAIAPSGFNWAIQQERGALSLLNGFVYVPFGGRLGDCGGYHGYVIGVPTSGSPTLNIYQTPSTGSGIWGAGGVAIDDATGNVFAATGNAVSSGCSSVDQNDAVLRLSSTLVFQDYFMPQDWQANWCQNDQDLGSAGPLLISSNLLFQAGKRGGGFLLNPNSLGGVNGQLFPSPSPYSQAEVCFGNHSDATFGAFAYAAPFVYVECEGYGLVALNVNTSTASFTPCNTCAAPDWSAGGSATFGPPIVAAGAVWVVDGSGLYAFNASNGTLIYHSASFGVNRFVSPAEAGGQVFVPSNTVVRSFDMGFLTWTSLGGTWASSPDATAGSSTSEDVFARGTDNALWQDHWNGTAWGVFASRGGTMTADPGAVSNGTSRTDVFIRGSDNQLYQTTWNGTTWSALAPLGGVLTTGPDASLRAGTPGHVDVWVGGTDGQLYHKWSDDGGNTFGAWQALGGFLTSDPRAISWSSGRVDVFVRGSDLQLYHKWWDAGFPWSGWQALGGILTSAPDAASCTAGHLDVFVRGTDNGLWRRSWNGSSWSSWMSLGGIWTASPSAVCRPGTTTIDLFERGTDNAVWTTSLAAT